MEKKLEVWQTIFNETFLESDAKWCSAHYFASGSEHSPRDVASRHCTTDSPSRKKLWTKVSFASCSHSMSDYHSCPEVHFDSEGLCHPGFVDTFSFIREISSTNLQNKEVSVQAEPMTLFFSRKSWKSILYEFGKGVPRGGPGESQF